MCRKKISPSTYSKYYKQTDSLSFMFVHNSHDLICTITSAISMKYWWVMVLCSGMIGVLDINHKFLIQG